MRQVWETFGGVHPPENKAQSNSTPIAEIPLADTYVVPLNQHIGNEAQAIVAVGQRVLKGQKIADAQGTVSAAVHAPTSGEVIAIEARPVPHPSGMTSMSVVIEADGADKWTALSACDDYTQLDRHAILQRLREAGIAGMGGAGFPAEIKLNPRSNQHIHTLILNGTECEPYITADDRLMREHAKAIINGALLFDYVLQQPATILIGIEENKPEAIAAMRKAATGTKIDVVCFPTKYPSGGEKQLIQILTGQEVPGAAIPAEIGIVVQNVGTAFAAYRAIRYGEPLISRVTTVVGSSLAKQGNIYALIGTPIDHILRCYDYKASHNQRLIIGGPMMGYTTETTAIPVIKTTNCILAPSTDEIDEITPAQACIRCGVCAQVCPAQLLPQQLFWYAQAQDVDKLKDYHLFDCIECGACSYACPSHIPLVQYYRASKGEIRQQEHEKLAADKARERFDARKIRLQEAEKEKEAKRRARRQAAEQAKKQLANTSLTKNNTTSLIDSEEKRQRQHLTAKNHLQHIKQQLEAAQSEGEQHRIDALNARVNDAELKVTDAQAKLRQLKQNVSTGDLTAEKIKDKLSLNPLEKEQRVVDSLKKSLTTAQEMAMHAVQQQQPTAEALQLGVVKLQQKLHDAEARCKNLQQHDAAVSIVDPLTEAAADAAIAKANARAAAAATMSDEEKHTEQRRSLEARLAKAIARLKKAEQEKSEHTEVLRKSVEKLQEKLDNF